MIYADTAVKFANCFASIWTLLNLSAIIASPERREYNVDSENENNYRSFGRN
jgi:hypothetical protein